MKHSAWGYGLSLAMVCVMLMTLSMVGCNNKPAQGGEVSWNVGGSSSGSDSSGAGNEGSTAGEDDNSQAATDNGSQGGQTQNGGSTQNGGTSGNGSNPGSSANGQTNNGKPTTSKPGTTTNPVATTAKTYYVDSVAGSDNNNGLSQSKPFKTLNKVPSRLAPGSKVLLKKGSVFTGTFYINSVGTAAKPVVYGTYGTGAKPILHGQGQEYSVLHIQDSEYVELDGWEITDSPKGSPIRRGVYVSNSGDLLGGAIDHIYLKNLTVHAITANVNRGSAGIYVEVGQARGPAYYNDLRIEGCEIYDTGSCGIITDSYYSKRSGITTWDHDGAFTPFTNVVFRNNILRDMPGDGILLRNTKNAVMEYNTVYNTGYGTNTAYAGMWPYNCDGTIMQYNEVYNNRLAGGDGQGLDVDINCNDTVVQYNYSHNNEGGFILICTDGTGNNFNRGTVVRYNISQNDMHGAVTMKGRDVSGVKVYNNTFYTTKGYSNGTIDCLLWSTNSAVFTNNIFVNNGTSSSGSYGLFVDNKDGNGKSTSNKGLNFTFENNIFAGSAKAQAPKSEYSIKVSSSNRIGTDPGLSNPGKGSIGRSTAAGYKLKAGSVCKGAGKVVSNAGGKDFFGSAVSGTPSIGASQN